MPSRPWYAFYPKDYEQKTAHLTFVQDAAYRRLLDHYYMSRKPLPANAEILHRVCRAFDCAEQAAIDFVLGQFFTKTKRGYVQSRAQEEIARAENLSDTRRNAANARYANGGANAPANAEQKHTQSQSHIISSLSSDIGKKPRRQLSALPDAFPSPDDQVWALQHWASKRARLDVEDEVEKFRNHHQARATRSANWAASWRTWSMNAVKFNGESRGRKSEAHTNFAIGALEAAREFDEKRRSSGNS